VLQRSPALKPGNSTAAGAVPNSLPCLHVVLKAARSHTPEAYTKKMSKVWANKSWQSLSFG